MPHPNAINGRFNSEVLHCLNVPGGTAEDDEEMQNEILGRIRALDKN